MNENYKVRVVVLIRKNIQLLVALLLIIAFVLWIFSIIYSRLNLSTMSGIGLFSVLPSYFFIAFSLLISSFFLTLLTNRKKEKSFFVLQTLLLIVFVNLTPSLIEGSPRFTASFINYQAVDYISKVGTINPSVMWVHNWPSFSILASEFSQISLVPADAILLFYPTFFNMLLIFPLYALFNLLLHNSRMVQLATWFVLLANWIGQDYFSMQSVAFFVVIFIIYLFFKIMDYGPNLRQYSIILLILFFYLASSHLLSAIVILSIALFLFLSKYMNRFILFASLAIITLGWIVFNASNYLAENLGTFVNQALQFNLIFDQNITGRLSGGSIHIFVNEVRIVYSIIIFVIGLFSTILIWRSKHFGTTDRRVFLTLGALLTPIIAFAYGGELFMRLYMFSLIPLAYFTSKALVKRRIFFSGIILLLVIAGPSLIIVTRYGNETMDYMPFSEASGIQFLYSHTDSNSNVAHVIGGARHSGDFRDYNYHENYTSQSLIDIYLKNASSSLWNSSSNIRKERYLCISYESDIYFSDYKASTNFLPELEGNISISVNYNLVFSNPSFTIYYSPKK